MQTYADWYRDQQGNAIQGGQVTVFVANSSTLATIYEPVANGTPTVTKANPFTTDANGYFQFAAANGSYSVQLSGNSSSTQVIPYIYLGDLSTSSTGGSGAAGSANQVQYSVGAGIFGASANFTFNPSTNVMVVGGTGTPASLTGVKINAYDSTNGFLQTNIQNLSTGVLASSDVVATSNTGTDTTNYVNMGINNSTFVDATWTINGANDAYLYSGSTNLSIGAPTAGKYINFFVGGSLAANEVGRVTTTQWTIPMTTAASSTTTGALVVSGGVGIALNTYVGGNAIVTGTVSSSVLSISNTAGTTRTLNIQTSGANRWRIIANSVAEGGADAGSNFSLDAFTDAGASIDSPIAITRASGGAITLAGSTNRAVIVNGTSGLVAGVLGVSAAAGTVRAVNMQTAGSNRWRMITNSVAEGGADAGSNWSLDAFTDAGAAIDSPITITRASAGAIALGGTSARPVTFSGRINLAAIAATANNGDIFQDSAQKYIGTFVDGVKQGVSTALFTQTADGTCANTLVETAISSTGVGTLTLPANFLVAGKTLRIRASGTIGITATPTIQLKVKYGSSIIGQNTAVTGVAGVWNIDFNITLRTAGASGTYISGGRFGLIPTGAAEGAYAVTSSAANIDTTTSNALSLTATWSAASASNTITCNLLTVEVLN